MKTCMLTGVLFWMSITGTAQFYDFLSPASTGLGLSGAVDTTAWSFFSNPAGYASQSAPAAGIGFHNAYGLSQLSSKSAFVHLPSRLITTSAGYVHYGSSVFNMQRFSAGLSRAITPHLSMGLRFGYLLRTIRGEESRGALVADAGIRLVLSPRWQIGILAQNPSQASISGYDGDQPLPSSLAVALKWRSTPLFSVNAEARQQLHGLPASYAFGIMAHVHRRVLLRGVVSGKPVRLAVGAGLGWEAFHFDLSVNHHQPLGFSSSAGISYSFNFNGKKEPL